MRARTRAASWSPRTALALALALLLMPPAVLAQEEGPSPSPEASAGVEPWPSTEPGPSPTLEPVIVMPPRPNVVVILLDDVPPLDGRLWSVLPTVRRLFVEHGLELTDFHGETPVCCPGRAGFLTGLHTHHHGVVRNDGRLFRPRMTLATQMRRAGYHTIHVGKYLNRFDAMGDKTPPGWADFHGSGGGYYGYLMWSNGQARYHGYSERDYSTDVITRLSVRAIRSAPRNRPLLAWISPSAGHLPLAPAPRHGGDRRCERLERWKPFGYMERRTDDKPGYVRRKPLQAMSGYDLRPVCRTLLSVDDLVRRVIVALRDTDRLRDTLIILTGDNGMTFGAHRLLNDKKSPYATQLPFLAVWPRVLGDTPRRIDERIQNIDLAPTLCELAGCELGPYPTGQRSPDGVSFAGLLLGTTEDLERAAVLSSYLDPGRHVPTWFGVDTTADSPLAHERCRMRDEGGCRWSYVEYRSGERELYDVSNGPCWAWKKGAPGDPCRLVNRAGQDSYKAIERKLHRALARLRRD